jgi:hypothetical protein
MKKIFKKNLFHLISLLFVFVPVLIFAAEGRLPNNTYSINNPLASDSIQGILLNIMNLVTTIGMVVVVLFIIYAGFTYVMAGGDPAKIKKARDTFFATVIGGAILLGADVIANVVVKTVESTVGAN